MWDHENDTAKREVFIQRSFGHDNWRSRELRTLYMVKEMLSLDVERIVVFSGDEEKQLDMRRRISDPD